MTGEPNGYPWHAEPAAAARGTGHGTVLREQVPHDRSRMRIATAEQVIEDAFAGATFGAADREAIRIAFAAVRDCLAEARELSKHAQAEFALARRERIRARAERAGDTARPPARQAPQTAAMQVVADAPGTVFCPDPRDAATPGELMSTLRQYWLWAGRPSYRTMASQCGYGAAASTLHAAMNSDKLPRLHLILAIIAGCCGTSEHQQAFASAWRRLQMDPRPARRPQAAARRIRDTA